MGQRSQVGEPQYREPRRSARKRKSDKNPPRMPEQPWKRHPPAILMRER